MCSSYITDMSTGSSGYLTSKTLFIHISSFNETGILGGLQKRTLWKKSSFECIPFHNHTLIILAALMLYI